MLSLLGSIRGGSSFITNSLRFRSSASAYLSRTFITPTSNTTWTWSGWVKRGGLGVWNSIFSSAPGGNAFAFSPTNNLIFALGNVEVATSTAVFRDPSAYYHLVVRSNGTNIKGFVNNLEVLSYTGTIPAINSAATHYIFSNRGIDNFVDGYLTEVHFIDGQALTPASFGAIDSSTGVWAPRPYSGTYGANGFYLKFANTSSVAALGNDSSGNNNTWTVNNVSLTAGATYDSMIDVPVNYSDGGNGRGNYAVLNPLLGSSSTGPLDGNLSVGFNANMGRKATIAVSSGKWYWECNFVTPFLDSVIVGVCRPADVDVFTLSATGYGYLSVGLKANSGSGVAYGAAFGLADTIGIAFNADAGTIEFYKNNVSQGVAYTGLSGEFVPAFCTNASGSTNFRPNFGQRPFAYTPPAGFRALNTNNLPTPSIVNGANFMAATTYTGNAAARSLSNAVNSVSFQPDLVWIKSRTPGATNHALFDSVRGTGKYLSSSTTSAETTDASTLTAFNGDGFSLGTDTTIVNANANSYIAWQWRESITAGLDVVSYAGTGVDRTVAHNLGVAPAMIIVKRSQTGATSNWQVRHTSIPVANSIQLNLPNQAAAATTVWASTAPTSSVFTVGTSADVNASGVSYVAYCFAEIAGFSRFGSYTANGLPDGPFVFCGFRPRFVMIKRTNTTGNWALIDSSRSLFNAASDNLYANLGDFETSIVRLDALSNGFKLRTTGGDFNGASGDTYIFAAFAENPSKYALAR
jgi:hypothetical protein